MGRFSQFVRQILMAKTRLMANKKPSALEATGSDDNSAPVGSGSNRLAAADAKLNRGDQRRSSTLKRSTVTKPARLSCRGSTARKISSVSKASTSNAGLRKKCEQPSPESGSTMDLEEEDVPAPYVLNFLYSNDVKTTKTRYAEEWVSNTKFAESGSPVELAQINFMFRKNLPCCRFECFVASLSV